MKTKTKSVKSLKMFLNKDKDELVLNPELGSDRKPMSEAKESHAVMAYGRMNPPTTGHAALVDKMHEVAKKHDAYHVLIASHSQDAKKNPLSGTDKLKHLKRYFPNTNITLANKEHPTFLQHAAKLHSEGHTHLHMIAGSDRVEEYKQKLHQYNGTGEGKLFNFKHIEVHSSGERDPDAEGTSGMSASKMREHATSNNFKEFKKGVPKHVSNEHAKELYHDTRKGMKLEEGVLDYSARRKRAINLKKRQPRMTRMRQIALKRFASELKLRRRAQNAARALIRTRVASDRGANYTNLSTGDKIAVDKMVQGKEKLVKAIAARLYQRVRKREMDRITRVRSGLPAKRQSKIINADIDYSSFSAMYDSLMESKFIIPEKELMALKIKAHKHQLPFEDIQEVYREAASNYIDDGRTLQQYCFDVVNSYVAEASSATRNAVKSHLNSATRLQQQGKFKRASIHRKIAAALGKEDHSTAAGLKQELRSIDESFVLDRQAGLGITLTAADLGIKAKGGFAHHPSVIKELIARGELEGEELENAIEEMRKSNE